MMVYFSDQQRQDGEIFLAIFRCLQNETVTNFFYNLLKIAIVIYSDKTEILILLLIVSTDGSGQQYLPEFLTQA
ncbi:hypothetical protein LNP17_14475 [Klebsiella variicola subsp. variicola]|nr:hypothetical protein [Klebsiella variicola subsp. variicola]